jgi:hypothetical protein
MVYDLWFTIKYACYRRSSDRKSIPEQAYKDLMETLILYVEVDCADREFHFRKNEKIQYKHLTRRGAGLSWLTRIEANGDKKDRNTIVAREVKDIYDWYTNRRLQKVSESNDIAWEYFYRAVKIIRYL